MPQAETVQRVDVLVAGAGMAGLAYAVAVKDALGDAISVAVCDPALDHRIPTYRTSAIAAGPRHMLETLGVWFEIEARAQPINRMAITDSHVTDVVRPIFLNFEKAADGEPFAHMAFNHDVEAALESRARGLGVLFRSGAVSLITSGGAGTLVQLDEGTMRASLVVAADGPRSKLRELAGIRTVGWDYPVSGIVATIGHERDHGGCACEHFLPGGPFAVLPLTGNRSSIVWTEDRATAARLVTEPAAAFLAEVERRFGLDLGELTLLDQPRSWPLNLRIARDFTAPRLALIGDAAHVIHPLAGQGINLGFRDVAVLAEATVDQARLGLDPGASNVLAAYADARRFDAVAMAMGMDAMNRLFSTDATPLRLIRDLGLGVVDRLPELKRFLIREASGLSGSVPRLMRGELL
jgi:2-octaprenyl-6-methoxyphenol hydroxylase